MTPTKNVTQSCPRSWAALATLGTGLIAFACGTAPDEPELELATNVVQNAVTSETWRSSLFPEDWHPGYEDSSGYWLHDFSYAGYHRGEAEPPIGEGSIVANVVDYGADPSGHLESTGAIQAAIDAVEALGGGVVFMPEGTFRVRPGSNGWVLVIEGDGVVLRGAGAKKTFLFNDAEHMRNRAVIRVVGKANWYPATEEYYPPASEIPTHPNYEGNGIFLTQDIVRPSTEVPLETVAGLAVGDWVVVRASATSGFMAEHPNFWAGASDSSRLKGPTFYRRIEAVDTVNNVITVDIPTRYFLKVRDAARVYKVGAPVREVGLESFSIGMRLTTTPGLGNLDYNVQGTGAYDAHNSHAIRIERALDSWIDGIESHRAPVNATSHHLQSNGIRVDMSRSVTVQNSVMRNPLYEGAGGNGYPYAIGGAESLFKDNFASSGRHNFSIDRMRAMGNVLFRNTASHGFYLSDFHMHLSAANLIDSMVMSEDSWSAAPRDSGCCTSHGQTTTQSVFWNLQGYAREPGQTVVRSEQFGLGYVIGTSGYAHLVSRGTTSPTTTAPRDVLQGPGKGHLLEPQSLFLAQRNLRLPGSAPTVTVGAWNKETVRVFWHRVAGAAGYVVRTQAASGGTTGEIDVGSAHEAMLSGFELNDRYVVKVAAYDVNGLVGPESEPVRITPRVAISPEADTYVRDGTYAGQNFGDVNPLVVKNSSSGFNRIAYIRFDASELSGPVKSARLRLYTVRIGSTAGELYVAPVDEAWSESTSTWNTRPGVTSEVGKFDSAVGAGRWIEVDVTPYVNNRIGKDGLVSLAVHAPLDYGSEGWVEYASREHPNTDLHPQLVIEDGIVAVANKDTFVRGGTYAGENYGSLGSLFVKNASPDYTRFAYIEFRLDEFTRPVREAKLRLTTLRRGSWLAVNRVEAMLGAGSWNEGAVTFNSPPPLGNLQPVGSWTNLRTGWNVEIDVTNQANYSITSRRRLSFRIVSPSNTGDNGYVEYYSRETANENRRPMLIIHE